MEDGQLTYSGIYSVDIRYNQNALSKELSYYFFRYNFQEKVWEARKDNNPDFLAFTNLWLGLGSQEWEIHNDSKVPFTKKFNIESLVHFQHCSKDTFYKRNLTLSVCSRQEFTCNSGECISMVGRCDRRADCNDRFQICIIQLL